MDKKQYERYKIIDRILRRNHPEGLPLDVLLEQVNAATPCFEDQIQRRQLQYDLHHLRNDYGAPIPERRGARTIRYTDPTYSFVTHEIGQELKRIKATLEDIEDDNQRMRLKWLQNLIMIMQDTYAQDTMAIEVIDFGDNEMYEASDLVHQLFLHIINQQVIEITYAEGFAKNTKREIHPYFIRQYNNRWFLFGWNKDAANDPRIKDGILNLALDRIRKIKPVRTTYRVVSVEKLREFKESYFDGIVGVTRRDASPIHLVLRFDFNTSDAQANKAALRDYYYMKTKPFSPDLHFPSDSKIQEDGFAEVWLDIIPNKELEAILLRYADTAKIIEPTDFRQRMLNRIYQIVNKQEK